MQPFCLGLSDFTKPFYTESDASDIAVGGVLMQEHTSVHKPIAFLSKTLTISKLNYTVHDCVLLSIVTYCKAWRPTTNTTIHFPPLGQ